MMIIGRALRAVLTVSKRPDVQGSDHDSNMNKTLEFYTFHIAYNTDWKISPKEPLRNSRNPGNRGKVPVRHDTLPLPLYRVMHKNDIYSD
jgi:hypothetical protein